MLQILEGDGKDLMPYHVHDFGAPWSTMSPRR
ncbi:hypothetical protein LINGRAHAP2_LOCUS4302 [Linum grandiflorum]